jgi:hypothetical protein
MICCNCAGSPATSKFYVFDVARVTPARARGVTTAFDAEQHSDRQRYSPLTATSSDRRSRATAIEQFRWPDHGHAAGAHPARVRLSRGWMPLWAFGGGAADAKALAGLVGVALAVCEPKIELPALFNPAV